MRAAGLAAVSAHGRTTCARVSLSRPTTRGASPASRTSASIPPAPLDQSRAQPQPLRGFGTGRPAHGPCQLKSARKPSGADRNNTRRGAHSLQPKQLLSRTLSLDGYSIKNGKRGLPGLDASISAGFKYHSSDEIAASDPRPDDIVERFREYCSERCADANPTLSGLALASKKLATQLPHVSGSIYTLGGMREELQSSGFVRERTVMLTLPWPGPAENAHKRKDRPGDFTIKIPFLQVSAARSKTLLDAPILRIDLYMRPKAEPLGSSTAPAQELLPDRELERVARMSAIVAQRVWDDVFLRSYETAAQTIAEAILRVVRTRDESVFTSGVSVRLNIPGKSPTYTGGATLVEDERDGTEDAPKADSGYLLRAEQSDSSETVKGDGKDAIVQRESDVKHHSGGQSVLSSDGFETSDTLNDQVGLQDIKFAIEWQGLAKSAALHKSVQDMQRTIEDLLAQAAGPGLKCLYIAAQKLCHMDPKPKMVDLTFRGQRLATCAQALSGETPQGSSQHDSRDSNLETGNEDPGVRKGLLSLNLRHSHRWKGLDNRGPVQVIITVRHVFRAKLTERALLRPFNSAAALMESIVSIVQAVTLDTAFPNEQALTNVVANALFEERGKFADVCQLTRVDLHVPMSDAADGTFSASKESLRDDAQAFNHLPRVGGAGKADRATPSKREMLREEDESRTPAKSLPSTPTLIALGSNVGDRLACIEDACRALDADPDIRVTKTSALYETQAMYVEDQAPFLNGVCEIETTLGPLELLDRTQGIEQQLGRVKTVDKGPRNIDLDILLHGDTVMETDRLTIPHQLMHERLFVLRPMSDIISLKTLRSPKTSKTYAQHLNLLKSSAPRMFSVTTLGFGCQELRPGDPQQGTIVMSILNVTPDSFSDGGQNATTDQDSLKDTIRAHIAGGAKIIDVGGQSSRPNAPDVTAEQEIARVLPAIQAIKSLPEAEGVAISVDTYRAAVAEAAVNAGAHIVNDISAGLLDAEMLATVARLGCTYIMMHMRGTPSTMMSDENCTYPRGLKRTISQELGERVAAALEAGIRRWRIILDPGIGFSKGAAHNVVLLRSLSQLRNQCPYPNSLISPWPWLVGASRKGFIGKFTGVEDPKERIWGTSATVVAAVAGGADIVRVHDVDGMAKVAKMADAIYREDGT